MAVVMLRVISEVRADRIADLPIGLMAAPEPTASPASTKKFW
jgi:hypothetical protein